MNEDFAPDSQLAALLDRMLDGQLTADECPRLNDLLRSSAAARCQYRCYLALHAMMTWEGMELATTLALHGSGQPAEQLPQPTEISVEKISVETESVEKIDRENSPQPAVGPRSIVLGFLGQLSDFVQRSPQMTLMFLVGTLVGYFLAIMALVPLARWAQSTQQQAIRPEPEAGIREIAPPAARLAGVRGCRWNAVAPRFGASVERQTLELAEGIVELTFADAVRVVIEGPATFEVESIGRLRLDRGKLAAVVPQSGAGFAVATPLAEVIDLGTEFGVEVDAAGATNVHVLRGRVELKPGPDKGHATTAPPTVLKLEAGQAIRIAEPGKPATRIPFDRPSFDDIARIGRQGAPAVAAKDETEPVSKIWLGNLFDDPPGTPLAVALQTDVYASAAAAGNLGIHRVIHGADRPKSSGDYTASPAYPDGLIEIAPGVTFDFSNLGWHGKAFGGVANDAYSRLQVNASVAIRTLGIGLDMPLQKIEEGIGMHADALVTFDIDQIRAAGTLEQRHLEFVCDRAGVNDDQIDARVHASLHMIAIVSTRAGVLTAIVNGHEVQLRQARGVWSVAAPPLEPMTANGVFFSVRTPLSTEAKYLTLVVTGFNDSTNMDHGVWSGARLEVLSGRAR